MASTVKFAESGVQHCAVPVHLSPGLPGLVLCASYLFPSLSPWEAGNCLICSPGWSCATVGRGRARMCVLSCGRGALVQPTGVRGEVCYQGSERAPNLSSSSDFHPQHPGTGKAPLTPHTTRVHVSLGAWYWAGGQDTSGNARGSQRTCLRWAPPWVIFGCVCQRASPAALLCEPPRRSTWDSPQHGRAECRAAIHQHRAQGEHREQDREAQAGRTTLFFPAFIHTFMS